MLAVGRDRLGLRWMCPGEKIELVLCILQDGSVGLGLGLQVATAARRLSGLEDQRPTIEGLSGGLTVGANANELVLHPGLQLRNLGQTVRDLEPLKLADDPSCLHVLIKVDHGHLTVVRRERTERLVAMVDKRKIGQVGPDERQTRWHMVLQPLAQHRVVPRNINDAAKVFQGSLSLLGHNLPSPLQSGDHRQVQGADDGHDRVVVVQLQALVGDLDPAFDSGRPLLRLLKAEN